MTRIFVALFKLSIGGMCNVLTAIHFVCKLERHIGSGHQWPSRDQHMLTITIENRNNFCFVYAIRYTNNRAWYIAGVIYFLHIFLTFLPLSRESSRISRITVANLLAVSRWFIDYDPFIRGRLSMRVSIRRRKPILSWPSSILCRSLSRK